MAGKKVWAACFVMILLALVMTVPAFADDEELAELIPGTWTAADEVPAEGGEPVEVTETVEFLEDGTLNARFESGDGSFAYTYTGTWTFELVAGGMDRLTLYFSSTDNPAYAGTGYGVECAYNVYSEAWPEDNTYITYLIIEDTGEDDGTISPFENAYGYDGTALRREQGPNMQVVNCDEYVSLRKAADKSSARIEKVPLGALVLAYPEEEQNGFILCIYHSEYGYILADYLAPVDDIMEEAEETEETEETAGE